MRFLEIAGGIIVGGTVLFIIVALLIAAGIGGCVSYRRYEESKRQEQLFHLLTE